MRWGVVQKYENIVYGQRLADSSSGLRHLHTRPSDWQTGLLQVQRFSRWLLRAEVNCHIILKHATSLKAHGHRIKLNSFDNPHLPFRWRVDSHPKFQLGQIRHAVPGNQGNGPLWQSRFLLSPFTTDRNCWDYVGILGMCVTLVPTVPKWGGGKSSWELQWNLLN